MIESCPISQRRVDTHVVRVIALLITLSALLFLSTSHVIFVWLLLVDFSLRLFRYNRLSPFFQLAMLVLRYLNIQPHMSDEAPKRFALYLGWGISIMIVLLGSFGFYVQTLYLTSILLLCASLEMLFEFCVGCKVYQYLKRFKIL